MSSRPTFNILLFSCQHFTVQYSQHFAVVNISLFSTVNILLLSTFHGSVQSTFCCSVVNISRFSTVNIFHSVVNISLFSTVNILLFSCQHVSATWLLLMKAWKFPPVTESPQLVTEDTASVITSLLSQQLRSRGYDPLSSMSI